MPPNWSRSGRKERNSVVLADEETLRTWAFGSSTPREFAHLMMIPPHLRQYDAKIVKPRLETRSFTNPNMRTSSGETRLSPHFVAVPTRSSNQPETTTRHSSEEDELDIASSEPDFVQDRRPDFLIKAKAKVTGGFESAQQLARQVEQPQTVPTAIHEDETAHVNEQVRQRKKGSWQVVDERDDSMLINEPSDDLDD